MSFRIRFLAGLAVSLLLSAGSLFAHDPHDPFVLVAISPNYAVDQTMLAGSYGLTIKLGVTVLMKSTNGGVNWSVVPGLFTNSNLSGLAFSPGYAQDQTIFVASSAGLYRSTNQGSSWTSIATDNLVSLALSPNFINDNTLYVITNLNTILKSTNRGNTFTAVSAPGLLTAGLNTIAISPNFAADHTLLLGGIADGIFKSFDGGNTWNSVTVGLNLPMVTALAFSPSFASDRTAFAGTLGAGFLMSTNNGNSWTQSNSGLTDLNVSSLALSPTYQTDSSLWVTTAVNGVFASVTRGQSWNPPVTVPRQLSDLTSVHYQVFTAGPGVQLLGMFEGLWISANDGTSWQYIDTLPTRSVRYINVSPNYARDQTVFVSTYGSGNLWSYNGGASWSLQNTGMQAPYTDGSGISPNFAADGIAFSGNHSGLQRTNNRGATWTMLPGPGGAAYPRGFAVSPNFAADQTVYIGTTSAGGHPANPSVFDISHDSKTPEGLYVSTNAGQTWNLSGLQGQGVISIAFSPAFATDNTAFAASQNGGAFKTTNNAASWTKLKIPGISTNGGVAVVAVSPSFHVDQVVFAAGLSGTLYKSSDAGSTWSTVSRTKGVRILDLKFSPNYLVDQTLFAGTVQNGVMKSTDGGNSLSAVTTFPDVFVTALGISPNFTNDLTLFAAGYHGLFKSTDGGSTWNYQVAPSRIEETRYVGSTLQEPPTITYQGIWSFVTSPSASTNGYADTTEAQDTAVLNFVGSGVRWLSWTGPLQGTASLSLDGVQLGTVSLVGGFDQFQQTVWEQHELPCGYHTFTITASPQTTQSVSLDAFDVWVDTCPFTNYLNPASLAANSAAVGSTAGSGSVLLSTTGPWQAASNAPWLSIAGTSVSGTGNTLIVYSYTANANQFSQTGTLTIAGLTFTVTQAGAGYVPVTPLASLVTSGLTNPLGVAVDGQGNVYIADTGDNAVKEWQPATQQLTTLVSSGLNAPSGVAVDLKGNVYIADTSNNAIEQWSPATQQLTTLISGLNGPTGIAVDALGDLYFANTGNNTIVGWNPATQQTSVLVSGLNSPTGVAVDTQGNVYFADTGNNAVKEWFPVTQQVSVLVSAGIVSPLGVAVDGYGNVYFADAGNLAIKEWVAATQQVTTLASSGLSYPTGVAVDTKSNIYIADRSGNAIRELTLAYLLLSATNLNEPATAGADLVTAQTLPANIPLTASSDQPWLTISSISGDVVNFTFAANTMMGSRIAHINVLGQVVTVTQAGSAESLAKTAGDGQVASLGQPFATNLQVILTAAGGSPVTGAPVTFTVIPGSNGAGGAFASTPPMPINTDQNGFATAPVLTANTIAGPFTVTATTGSLTVTFTLTNTSDLLGSYLAIVGNASGTGTVLLSAAGAWTAASNASWLSVSPASGTGSALIQFSYSANSISAIQSGTLTIDGLTFTVTQAGTAFSPGNVLTTLVSSGLNGPKGVAVDPQGNTVYIADSNNNAVEAWNTHTAQLTVLVSSGLNNPTSVAVDSQGNVYIADQGNSAIKEWSFQTQQVTSLVSAGIVHPLGVAVDSQGNVYFSDSGDNAIKEWSPVTGHVTTLVSFLDDPWGMALDALRNVYFSNLGTSVVDEWTYSGNQEITLVSSGLKGPRGVAVDGGGNVYIADTGNHAIELWNPVSRQLTQLFTQSLQAPSGVALDGQGNVYIADAANNTIKELTLAYVALGVTNTHEGAQAGADSVPVQVLPAGTSLAPFSDRSWLTILGVANGVISFSFSANTSVSSRTAHIEVLSQQATVTQAGDVAAIILKAAGGGQSASAGQAFAIPLQAKVEDAAGNGLASAPVTFTVVPGAGGATATFNSSPPMPILTGFGGSAAAPTLVAGTTLGTFTVTASTGSVSATYTLTVTP